jgi:hypothetical protein
MRVGQAGDVGDFCLMTLAVTMASPIAWDHHYGVLVPILAACGPAIVARQVVGRWTWPALIAAYLVASQFFPFMNGFAGTPLGVLQSYLLAAACGVFVLVSLSLRRTSAEKGRGQTAEGRSAERTDAIIH